ncbi:hypothetical protein AB4865_12510 [Capnocytophaga sp. ARDL2]|uniref:hypothetical protein n=1 Tax=Capnocytophaga sp. ARDL2 TaxID=3238809 RepID=UPI003557FD13
MNIEKTLHTILSFAYENEIIEFKEAKNTFDFSKLGKFFFALSNEANLQQKNEA